MFEQRRHNEAHLTRSADNMEHEWREYLFFFWFVLNRMCTQKGVHRGQRPRDKGSIRQVLA